MDMPTSFIWIIVFFSRPFEYGNGGIFKLLRWMQNLLQPKWDHELFYADRSSMDKHFLVIPLLRKTKNTNIAGGWMFKYTFYFLESTTWSVAIRHMKFCTLKYRGHTYKFYLYHYFLWRRFSILRWFDILRLCWDKRWIALRRNLYFCATSCL
jgi:hypothetical protein